MKIGLKCLHTCHISYVVWVCQHLFWSSSFTVEVTLWLCGYFQWWLGLCIFFIFFWFGFVCWWLFFDKLLCVRWCSTLEVWRGILDYKVKMGIMGLVCCWWSLVEVKLYEETFVVEKEVKIKKTESLCYFFLEFVVNE